MTSKKSPTEFTLTPHKELFQSFIKELLSSCGHWEFKSKCKCLIDKQTKKSLMIWLIWSVSIDFENVNIALTHRVFLKDVHFPQHHQFALFLSAFIRSWIFVDQNSKGKSYIQPGIV